jgi:hypothetical protein
MNTQDQDYEYFLENMESLYKTHGNKIAVVKNSGILGVYDEFEEALETALKTEELGTFLIQKIYESKDKAEVVTSGHMVIGSGK